MYKIVKMDSLYFFHIDGAVICVYLILMTSYDVKNSEVSESRQNRHKVRQPKG